MLGGHDEVVGVGDACRLFYLLLGGIVHAEGYIVEKGIVEEYRLLVYIAHEGTEVVEAGVADVGAVDGDAAFRDVVEAGQQINQRTLSGTRLADEGDGLALRNLQVDTLQDVVVLILEPDVVITDGLLQADRLGGCRVVDIGLSQKNLVDAGHRGHAFLNGVGGFAQILGRVDYAIKDD